MAWKLKDLAKAAGAEGVVAQANIDIEAVNTDSRTLPAAALFVALRGETYDGHSFVDAAVAAGARAVLVDRAAVQKEPTWPGGNEVPRLVVNDTLRALGDMAQWVRRQADKPVVAVTGSNGKTTTKELLAAALGVRRPVHKTHGNLNNLIGLPQTLFAWPHEAWAAVLEMGMNAPGEIARLAEIAEPHVGLITCVAMAHLGGNGLGSLENIAKAKCELFERLQSGRIAVLNDDDAPLKAAAAAHLSGKQVARFGTGSGCDVQVIECASSAAGLRLRLRLQDTVVPVRLPLVGHHNAMNAAAAAAAALACGMKADDIAEGLARVNVPGSRLRLLEVPGGITVLDDCYNANPGSMRAAFAAQADVAGPRRRVAVLGDMLELGERAATLHREVGRAAGQAGIAQAFVLGEFAASFGAGCQDGGARASSYDNLENLLTDVRAYLEPDDVLLVKGSRGMRLERVVEFLLGGLG